MPENSPLTHSQRLRAANTTRKAMIDNLAGRFTVDEQGLLVSNGLSTNIICFPSDMDPSRRKFLRKKIQSQLETTANFADIEELNTLSRMPQRVPNGYSLLGLYLYFADECSRLGKDKTFLTAMREAGATLKADDFYNRTDLLTKTRQALTSLGMEDAHFNVLYQWYLNGTYKVGGELNASDANGNPVGTYARLAEQMSPDGKRLGINQAISFAVANKDKVKGLSPAAALEHMQALIKEPREIKKLVELGDKSRIERIKKVIVEQKKLGKLPKSLKHADALQPSDVLSLLPDAALELLYSEEYMFAYAHKENIQSIFPKDDLPGINHAVNEKSRESKGLRQSLYNMIFLSDGRRYGNPGDVDRDARLRARVVAQTLMHETMHDALGYLKTPGVDWHETSVANPLRDAVRAVSTELAQKEWEGSLPGYFHNRLETVDITNLAKLVDYNSADYMGYVITMNGPAIVRDPRWEEVVCQVASLMYTEFPYPPEQGKPNPYADLPSLGKLAEAINQALAQARDKCREKYANMKLPNQAASR